MKEETVKALQRKLSTLLAKRHKNVTVKVHLEAAFRDKKKIVVQVYVNRQKRTEMEFSPKYIKQAVLEEQTLETTKRVDSFSLEDLLRILLHPWPEVAPTER
ncbi:MAG: hypothetical protein ACOC6Q_02710 [Patescibacteria group bacterium]